MLCGAMYNLEKIISLQRYIFFFENGKKNMSKILTICPLLLLFGFCVFINCGVVE